MSSKSKKSRSRLANRNKNPQYLSPVVELDDEQNEFSPRQQDARFESTGGMVAGHRASSSRRNRSSGDRSGESKSSRRLKNIGTFDVSPPFTDESGQNDRHYSEHDRKSEPRRRTPPTSMSHSAPPAQQSESSGSIMPLPGFDEADLLKRAMERRALLHNRIAAMEKAKAELERGGGSSSVHDSSGRIMQESQQSSSQYARQSSPKYQSASSRHQPQQQQYTSPSSSRGRRHGRHPSDELPSADQQPGHESKVASHRARLSEQHARMNDISAKIKREAEEFMTFESKEYRHKSREGRVRNSRESLVDNLMSEFELNADGAFQRRLTDSMQPVDHMMEFSDNLSEDATPDDGDDDGSDGDLSPYDDDEDASPSYDVDEHAFMMDEHDFMNSFHDGNIAPPQQAMQAEARIDSSAWDASSSLDVDRTSNVHRRDRSYDSNDGLSEPVTPQKPVTLRDEDGPTPQQLSRYSNMVRLGIPDVAVLRAMDRDSVIDPKSILKQLKHDAEENKSRSKFRRMSTEESAASTVRSEVSDDDHRPQHECATNDGRISLSDDPHYSKYFKMMKAKVPQSWVKRVLEVDGKNPRILEMDPDLPLADQVGACNIDENGNVDWDNITPTTPSQACRQSDQPEDISDARPVIPSEMLNSVKAELAAMTARAAGEISRGGGSSAPSDEGSDQSTPIIGTEAAKPSPANPADITSAAVAASNARMIRLNALRANNESSNKTSSKLEAVGRQRKSVDEIRRRLPTATRDASKRNMTFPSASAKQASSDKSQSNSNRDSADGDLPLKDDPRFAKYFQMIRSRVPRSWVERVIEVDDRDPAILDLDPNKSLASQIGDDHAEDGHDGETSLGSSFASLDDTDTSAVSSKSKSTFMTAPDEIKEESVPFKRADTNSTAITSNILAHAGDQIESEDSTAKGVAMPFPTEIGDDEKAVDEASIASSITAPRDNDEKSAASQSFDLSKIAAYLNQIESKVTDANDTEANAQADLKSATAEEIENRLAVILKKFSTREEKVEEEATQETDAQEIEAQEIEAQETEAQETEDEDEFKDAIEVEPVEEPPEEKTDEQLHQEQLQRVVEKSQAEIFKLSSLLASNLENKTSGPDESGEQPDIERLPMLLSQVLEKMEEQAASSKESNDRKSAANKALEAMFAKRSSVAVEEDEPTLRDNPDYSKYFKMLKLGLPRPSVLQALERDGKDVRILDLDPHMPLSVQQDKLKATEKPTPLPKSKNAALEGLFAKRAAVQKESDEASQPKDKKAALEAMFAKRAAVMAMDGEDEAKAEPTPMSTTAALEAMFAKRAATMGGAEETKPNPKQSSIPIRNDPDFKKYFKMLKVGMPIDSVRQALERDGKDPAIADFDPDKSYASQSKEEEVPTEDVPLKDDPNYAKFFKMLKMGIPEGAVRQALQKEGKDPDVASMDPDKSYASQAKPKVQDGPPLKDDPEYAKFFKMLKMMIPEGAVRQAIQKEGKDVSILDMDPSKSYASQKSAQKEVGPPLKDDPEYQKFFKMLKMGIPLGAVQNALKKEGKDPGIINMDPNKPLSEQQSKPKETKKLSKPKGPKVARKRLHWNKIDESKLHADSFWNQAKEQDLQLVGLDFDNEEFANLFTSEVGKAAAKKEAPADDKKKSKNQKVQLIDGRRRMNGSILLAKFKVDYKVLAKQVDGMEYMEAEGNELRGMMQLLPTKDESLALRSYLPPLDAPAEEIDESIAKLGECEQYMAVMLDVPDVKDKFQAMLFRAEYETHADNIREGTEMLNQACDAVKNSERFRKLLLYALKLGNALNTGGSNEAVSAITLDSLLKLAEAKAFDKQTSALHYLVSIVQKNDEDVLNLSQDFVPVKAAERVATDMLASQLKEMQSGVRVVKDVVKRNLPADTPCDETSSEEEILNSTSMGKFSISATSQILSLANEFGKAKGNFSNLLQFFGEDNTMSPEAFFCTINTFVSMFENTHKELVRREEAKERRKRIDEKRRIREEEKKKTATKVSKPKLRAAV